MKRLTAIIMFMAFLVLPLTSDAGQCERYWDGLAKQCFAVTVDDIEYTLCFSDSCFGPCPSGQATLSYTNIQEFFYSTTPDLVTVAGLDFILISGKLILLSEDPLIFEKVKEN